LTAAHPALALVDEKLSTKGTGLGLGSILKHTRLAKAFGFEKHNYQTFSKDLKKVDISRGPH
jgi:hypothetical protein